ncbi:asparagine synthase (glutamine-hydrolyzing) [Cellulomonas cellasea]|uniref:asparagine synthase (glutamine-hydrolyzing) n=1 Tax=Cellulomonas cellasea TaxID=43670 RepID=A0A7W4UIQ3_9CELL|nr:asparagine synthase (glutamine-hydrolyzing) [Cellulomonas cellasea]MBB2924544.1 asparagine synthase (glutamine-hydrolyzing) [Cellulomonas cellasea]
MCGIAGVLAQGAVAEDLDAALVRLAHRGPDDTGTWAGPGVVLGHRRLSVVDPTPAGHQPMLSPSGRYVLTFNGEIYNHDELRAELVGRGHVFRSRTDSEVVLAAFVEWGEACVERFVGMFAFAVWDRDDRMLTLVRDRIGEKPLYYAHVGGRFAFASEIAALAGLPWVPTDLDHDAVRLFLAFRNVPSPWTIRAAIRKVPPAHVLRLRDDRIEVEPYWRPEDHLAAPRLQIDRAEALDTLDGLLGRAVRGQVVADVPVGAFLSGGIDSSLVTALMTETAQRPVRTFTVGFTDAVHDESPHAAAVAQHLGTEHHALHLDESAALALVPELPQIYGEPFADASALPTRLVAASARRVVTVCLTGDGGDETFGGYERYDKLGRYAAPARALAPVGAAAQAVAHRLPPSVRRIARIAGMSAPDVARTLLAVTSPRTVARMTGGPVPPYPGGPWHLGDVALRHRSMVSDLTGYLPDQLLTKVDRAAMSVSLETRAPLLDHRVVEFSLRLPPELLVGKSLLRELLHRRVPPALVDRPKQGFTVPLARWLRGGLRPLLHDTLTPAVLADAGVVDTAAVADLLRRHDAGENHAAALWALLMLCLWVSAPPAGFRAAAHG